jgi:plastocyanin
MTRLKHLAALSSVLLIVSACDGAGGDTTTSTSQPTTSSTSQPDTSSSSQPATTTSSTGGTSTSEDSDSADAEIRISNFTFLVGSSVSVGETVRVTNEDDIPHTWTAVDGAFDSNSISAGGSFEFTFEDPGEYDFFCKFHPSQMTGSITVSG